MSFISLVRSRHVQRHIRIYRVRLLPPPHHSRPTVIHRQRNARPGCLFMPYYLNGRNADERVENVIEQSRVLVGYNVLDINAQRFQDRVASIDRSAEYWQFHEECAHALPLRPHAGEHIPHRPFLERDVLQLFR